MLSKEYDAFLLLLSPFSNPIARKLFFLHVFNTMMNCDLIFGGISHRGCCLMISMGHFYMNIQFVILYMTYGDFHFYTDYRVAYSLFKREKKLGTYITLYTSSDMILLIILLFDIKWILIL